MLLQTRVVICYGAQQQQQQQQQQKYLQTVNNFVSLIKNFTFELIA